MVVVLVVFLFKGVNKLHWNTVASDDSTTDGVFGFYVQKQGVNLWNLRA